MGFSADLSYFASFPALFFTGGSGNGGGDSGGNSESGDGGSGGGSGSAVSLLVLLLGLTATGLILLRFELDQMPKKKHKSGKQLQPHTVSFLLQRMFAVLLGVIAIYVLMVHCYFSLCPPPPSPLPLPFCCPWQVV